MFHVEHKSINSFVNFLLFYINSVILLKKIIYIEYKTVFLWIDLLIFNLVNPFFI